MGLDPVLPRRRGGADESRRQLHAPPPRPRGLERLAEPLLGGIYAGNVDALSLRAAFPQLLDLEEKYGSLIRGTLAQRAEHPARRGQGAGERVHFAARRHGRARRDARRAPIDKLGGAIRIGAEVEAVTEPATPTLASG